MFRVHTSDIILIPRMFLCHSGLPDRGYYFFLETSSVRAPFS